MVTSVVIGSAFAVAVLLAVVLTAVIWAVVVAAVGVLVVVSVLVADDVDVLSTEFVDVCSSAVAVVDDEVAVELLEVRRLCPSGRWSDPVPAVVDDAAAAVFDALDDVLVVRSAVADDEVEVPAVDLGPRAVWPVDFFGDPEFDVAELDESDVELLSVSSALATATTGPASDNPSARAAIPALAPR